jgi:hypothetical protein
MTNLFVTCPFLIVGGGDGDGLERRGGLDGGVWVREREGLDGEAAAFYYQRVYITC